MFYISPLIVSFYAVSTSLIVLLLVKRYSKSSLHNIPGPAPDSFLLGNQAQYERAVVGERDSQWYREFGPTIRFKGGWGEDVLMTSDPKALQFILKTSSYNFGRLPLAQERSRKFIGLGILNVEHNDHKRHRKVMLPAFGLPETKALTPIFRAASRALVKKWEHDIENKKTGEITVNAHSWLSRATLDAIGEAAFDHKFGALEGTDNPLSRVYRNLILVIVGFASIPKIIITNTLIFLPPALTRLIFYIPTTASKRMAQNLKVSTEVAREILVAKEGLLGTDSESRDLMTLLLKSNSSENQKARLSEEELLGQMNSIMLAGHETTATALTFTLWELAKHPDVQDRLRAEVRKWYQEALDRGQSSVPVTDYDKMPYTAAVIKETLRLNPLLPLLMRQACKDLVVPLSKPISTPKGEIWEVPVKKDTRVMISITQYNRHTELWGPDAYVYNPERWLADPKETKIQFGVYGNLGTFGAGIHACLGWRFAVYEIQTFLIELLNKFKFELTEETKTVRCVFAGLNVPLVKGNNHETSIPLKISHAP